MLLRKAVKYEYEGGQGKDIKKQTEFEQISIYKSLGFEEKEKILF